MIAFVHLYNDRSGSPRVLHGVISDVAKEHDCRLFIGSDGDGILDAYSSISVKYWYRRTQHKLTTLMTFAVSQISLIYSLVRTLRRPKEDIIYINTLLPFGAAIFGRLSGRRVIYHLHEVSLNPAILQRFLTWIARLCASHLIYVSKFHQSRLQILGVPYSIIYNSIDHSILAEAASHDYVHREKGIFSVLMLASGRNYKGIPEFIRLARELECREDIHFTLVLSSDESNIRNSEEKIGLPRNMSFAAATTNPAIYYRQASLVLNLSRIDSWQETFGLTILEAMTFGIPVIAPPVGGPTEIVANGKDGFLIDSRKTLELRQRVLDLADNPALSLRLSKAARLKAEQFDSNRFHHAIRRILDRSVNPLGTIPQNDQ